MKTKIDEATIENRLLSSIRQRNNVVFAQQQVYVSGKRIDIVYKDECHEGLAAIEVKLSNWKSALRQANLNKFAVSHSYVAMWYEHANAAVENVDEFIDCGVGLIIIDSTYSMNIILRPRNNPSLNRQYQENLSMNLSDTLCAV